MFFFYDVIICLLEETFLFIQRKIARCPDNTKVWALLPLIVYMIPFISVFLEAKLEQTIFVFFVLTIIFYQKVEKSLETVKKEWKFRYIEVWLLPFTIPAYFLVGLGIVKVEK